MLYLIINRNYFDCFYSEFTHYYQTVFSCGERYQIFILGFLIQVTLYTYIK